MVELVSGFVHLLAQEMERGQDLRARVVGVKLDIVAHGIGGEEAIDAARGEQFPTDNVVQEFLRLLEEFLGLWSFQDGRVSPAQFPGVEEGRPVDEGNEDGQAKAWSVERGGGGG